MAQENQISGQYGNGENRRNKYENEISKMAKAAAILPRSHISKRRRNQYGEAMAACGEMKC